MALRQCVRTQQNVLAILAANVRRRHCWSAACQRRAPVVAWVDDMLQAPAWTLPPLQHPQQQPHRRLSTSSNAVLSNTTSFLRNLHNGAEIFLVGTAHISKQSAEEVREMIRLVKPSSVMVELCQQRAARIRAGADSDTQGFFKDMLESFMAPGSSLSQKLARVSLPAMYRMLKLWGMDPGAEFKAALEEADRVGARVVYGDRDVNVTLKLISENLRFEDLFGMGMGLGPNMSPELADLVGQLGNGSMESKVEAMKTRKMVREMTAYMRQINPRLAAALIDERDQHMTEVLSRLEGRVVGVVGLAHLDGIERRWESLMHSKHAVARR